jgi:hypothetical protein
MVQEMLVIMFMEKNKLIAVRHVRAGDRTIPVELFLNEGGSVAAHCILTDTDRPIIDSPTPEEAIATIEDLIDGILLTRAAAS